MEQIQSYTELQREPIKPKVKANKHIVESVIAQIQNPDGRFTPHDVLNSLLEQGYDFGSTIKLAHDAQLQATRRLIGQITDENGRRKYVARIHGDPGQMAWGFEADTGYCEAGKIYKSPDAIKKLRRTFKRYITSIIRRTPIFLLPEEVGAVMIAAIEQGFQELEDA